MSVVGGEVFQDGIWPDFLDGTGVKKSEGERQTLADFLGIVVEELDVVIDQGVTDAEGGSGKLGGESGIHVGLVAAVGPQGIGSEHGGEELAVGDDLHFCDDERPRLLIELLIGELGIPHCERCGEGVVLADE